MLHSRWGRRSDHQSSVPGCSFRIQSSSRVGVRREWFTCESQVCIQTRTYSNSLSLLSLLAPQRDGSDVYATLHLHKVDDHNLFDESKCPTVFWVGAGEPPRGWEWVDKDDADAIRVCRAHPWQCDKLLFGPHEDEYGTAKHPSYECAIGSANRMANYSEGFIQMSIDASKLQRFSACDHLLRLRRPQPHRTPAPSRA
jgi:hypothetical protein